MLSVNDYAHLCGKYKNNHAFATDLKGKENQMEKN